MLCAATANETLRALLKARLRLIAAILSKNRNR